MDHIKLSGRGTALESTEEVQLLQKAIEEIPFEAIRKEIYSNELFSRNIEECDWYLVVWEFACGEENLI